MDNTNIFRTPLRFSFISSATGTQGTALDLTSTLLFKMVDALSTTTLSSTVTWELDVA